MPHDDTAGTPEREGRWEAVSEEWTSLSSQFATLGRSLRDQYDRDRDGERAREGAQELRQALERAFDSFAQAIDAGADAIRTPEVKSAARTSASALGEAISRTLDALAEEVNDAVARRKGDKDDEAEKPGDPG
jgi:predicted NBD/HSP70 family sugar kinase